MFSASFSMDRSKKASLAGWCNMSIFEMCIQYFIKLVMDWIPRGDNEVQYMLTTSANLEIWWLEVNLIIFQYLSKSWGPQLTVLHQTIANHQLEHIHSRFSVPIALSSAWQIIPFFWPIILFDYSQKFSPLFPYSRPTILMLKS